ncbi:hypothetical protein NDU88_000814 [Pleurodeles waltl]|uniref:Uncharacterized protein n=1 Tax=Pleurodeles waltl TaxID=8319 RepID=A0AAV7NBN0_PLEWA|nr:hypothetical protein NDU88_000814 [Pleurodeles waltl]
MLTGFSGAAFSAVLLAPSACFFMQSMAAEGKVQQALRLLEEAGRLDLVRPGAAVAARPVWKTASGVAAAVMAWSEAGEFPS